MCRPAGPVKGWVARLRLESKMRFLLLFVSFIVFNPALGWADSAQILTGYQQIESDQRKSSSAERVCHDSRSNKHAGNLNTGSSDHGPNHTPVSCFTANPSVTEAEQEVTVDIAVQYLKLAYLPITNNFYSRTYPPEIRPPLQTIRIRS